MRTAAAGDRVIHTVWGGGRRREGGGRPCPWDALAARLSSASPLPSLPASSPSDMDMGDTSVVPRKGPSAEGGAEEVRGGGCLGEQGDDRGRRLGRRRGIVTGRWRREASRRGRPGRWRGMRSREDVGVGWRLKEAGGGRERASRHALVRGTGNPILQGGGLGPDEGMQMWMLEIGILYPGTCG